MTKLMLIALIFFLCVFVAHSGKTQGSKEKVYVWDFTTNSKELEEVAGRSTEYFEQVLVEKNCYQVQQQRRVGDILSQFKNQKAIGSLRDVSLENRNEIQTITNAQTIVFGKVDDDKDDGTITVTVSFERFDSTIIKKAKADFSRGERFSKQARERAINLLIETICPEPTPTPKSTPTPTPKPTPTPDDRSFSANNFDLRLSPKDNRGYSTLLFKRGGGDWSSIYDTTVEEFVVAKNIFGKLEIFAISTWNARNVVYWFVETGPSQWTAPRQVGDFTATAKQIAVGSTSDGRLCVVARAGTDGSHMAYTCPPTSGSWQVIRSLDDVSLYADYSSRQRLSYSDFNSKRVVIVR